MLYHSSFNFRIAGNIDTILVNVKLIIDFDNVVIVLQEGCEFIKQEA